MEEIRYMTAIVNKGNKQTKIPASSAQNVCTKNRKEIQAYIKEIQVSYIAN